MDRYSPHGGFAAWAVTVSKNVCRTKLREEKQARAAEVSFGDGRGLTTEDSSAGSGEPEAARKDRWKQAVHAALGRLTDRERDVIVLRLLEGKGTGETAIALGISESAVRSILLRAMTRLSRMEELRGLLPDWNRLN